VLGDQGDTHSCPVAPPPLENCSTFAIPGGSSTTIPTNHRIPVERVTALYLDDRKQPGTDRRSTAHSPCWPEAAGSGPLRMGTFSEVRGLDIV
jgi:hypothetical protein